MQIDTDKLVADLKLQGFGIQRKYERFDKNGGRLHKKNFFMRPLCNNTGNTIVYIWKNSKNLDISELLGYGFATCNPKYDTFNKKRGFEIAFGRAYKDMLAKEEAKSNREFDFAPDRIFVGN